MRQRRWSSKAATRSATTTATARAGKAGAALLSRGERGSPPAATAWPPLATRTDASVWSAGVRLDLELAVEPPDLCVELERDRLVARGQAPSHFQRVPWRTSESEARRTCRGLSASKGSAERGC